MKHVGLTENKLTKNWTEKIFETLGMRDEDGL